jgi:hypothetical protein
MVCSLLHYVGGSASLTNDLDEAARRTIVGVFAIEHLAAPAREWPDIPRDERWKCVAPGFGHVVEPTFADHGLEYAYPNDQVPRRPYHPHFTLSYSGALTRQ